MAKITYVSHDGSEMMVDVPTGFSVMEGAIKNGVPGIDADCGGACACATCRVAVDEAWLGKLEPASEAERTMLEFASDVRDNTRLSCQIRVSDALDGLRVTTPESQY